MSIATVANAAAALVSDAGWAAVGAAATSWAVAVLILAAALGLGLAGANRGRLAPAASLTWGLAWIAVARATGEPESGVVAVVAACAAGAVVLGTTVARLKGLRGRRSRA